MNYFQFEIEPDGVCIKVAGPKGTVDPSAWMSQLGSDQHPQAIRLLTMLEAGEADVRPDGGLFLSNQEVVDLPESLIQAVGIPQRSAYALNVQHQGVINGQSEFQIHCRLTNSFGQPIIFERKGAFVRTGSQWWRLPASHFRLMDAADRVNATLSSGDTNERLRAYASLREYLPEENRDNIRSAPLLRQFQVFDAAAFTLRLRIEHGKLQFEPVLYAKRPTTNSLDDSLDPDPPPLLPDAASEDFAKLLRENSSRYALGGNRWVVLSKDLTKAMNAVKRLRDGGNREAHNRFFLNPTEVLREEFAKELGDEGLDQMLEGLFLETPEYLNDRVKGIGIWKKPVLPWIAKKGNDWFPPEVEGEPPSRGIRIEGEEGPIEMPLTSKDAATLRLDVEAAVERGEDFVDFNGKRIPANQATMDALDEVIKPKPRPRPENPTENFALLINGNYEGETYRRGLKRREARDAAPLPTGLRAQLQRHQIEGLKWMQAAWRSGMPGVLLADDMGLGKTLQTLAFLLWLKQNASARPEANAGGVLIVAPTSLLENWKTEHSTHLELPGLGTLVQAHGSGLNSLRCPEDQRLDQERLRKADWVLTTYETMKGYQTVFAAINFSVIVFDEAQKIKAPDSQVANAAKALLADFKVAVTGTPVENRRADLWCVTDTVYPGLLGSLKDFSRTYEKNETPENLQRLKGIIAKPGEELTPREFMMRRMKEEILEGLPQKKQATLDEVSALMPPFQAAAYKNILSESRDASTQGAKLEAIQKLRTVSLHPNLEDEPAADAVEEFINSSARLKVTCEILGRIRSVNEKALIFIHSRAMQDWMRLILAQRFSLTEVKVINGTTPSKTRNNIVSEFQNGLPGFAALILSPKAAGTGFTITAANHVIHLERWWNPAVEDQCTDRVYRIGQRRPVTVWLPRAIHPDSDIAGHTFDLKLHELLERKRYMSRELLSGVQNVDADTAKLFDETVGAAL